MSDDPDPDPTQTPADQQRWESLFMASLLEEGVPAGSEATLRFISSEEMTALNQEFMGGTGPTDVLSFPIDGLMLVDDAPSGEPDMDAEPDGPPAMVGDVVICTDVAAQAVTAERTLDDEIALLVVHGALHLIGHDHYEPGERDRMQSRERALLGKLYR